MLVVSDGKPSRNGGVSVSACDARPLRRVCVERRSPCTVVCLFGRLLLDNFFLIFLIGFEDGVRTTSLGSCDYLRSTDLPF
jgi:hypothetical protein